jgi:hypothetical protein
LVGKVGQARQFLQLCYNLAKFFVTKIKKLNLNSTTLTVTVLTIGTLTITKLTQTTNFYTVLEKEFLPILFRTKLLRKSCKYYTK